MFSGFASWIGADAVHAAPKASYAAEHTEQICSWTRPSHPKHFRWPTVGPMSLARPLGPCIKQLETFCPQPRARVGGWYATETPSALQRQVADVWRTALSETANSKHSWSYPGRCTVSPWVALSSGEIGGVSVNVYPLVSSQRQRDGGHVYVYVRQKCTMQSQKQWHFLSLTMVALFYN